MSGGTIARPMPYLNRDEIPEDDIDRVFEAMDKAFADESADVEVAMAAMCHRLAIIAASLTESEQEARELIGAFAGDVLRQTLVYWEDNEDVIGPVEGSA